MKNPFHKPRHYACSFCGKTQDQVLRLIAGPGGVYICDSCVADLHARYAGSQSREVERCSFCGKGAGGTVQYLVSSNLKSGVGICSECLDLCSEIIAEEEIAHSQPSKPSQDTSDG
jgi:ATP-dependent protease Clp ATPase subunit